MRKRAFDRALPTPQRELRGTGFGFLGRAHLSGGPPGGSPAAFYTGLCVMRGSVKEYGAPSMNNWA